MKTEHPSFGLIGAARWSAGGKGMRLFGSVLPGHASGVTLTIKEAYIVEDRGHEYVHGGRLVAQVHISPVQWAELLTSMNIGDGVPCTIRYVAGDTAEREPPPEKVAAAEKAKRDFATVLQSSADRLRDRRAAVAAKLRGKVTAGLAREIDIEFQMAEEAIRTNAPWQVERFTEAASKVVASAKAEVDAFLTTVAQQMGVKALQAGGLAGYLDGKEDSPADPDGWHKPAGCPWQIHTPVGTYFWTATVSEPADDAIGLLWFKGTGWLDEDDIVIGGAHTFAQAKQEAARHLACVAEGTIVPGRFRENRRGNLNG